MNSYVGRIAQQQVVSLWPPLHDNNSNNDDADKGDSASSPSDDEMSTSCTYPLSLMTKRESSHTHRGRVSIRDFC